MLIIPVLAVAFLPSSLFSCRLKGLELSVSSPSSACSKLYQLSGSAALIIIWPHLFGWLGHLWFSFCILDGSPQVRVNIHLTVWSAPIFYKRLFCDSSPPLMQCRLKQLCPGLRPLFFDKSLPINIKSRQEVTPPFSLLPPDKEHPRKHTGTTH